MCRLIDLLVGKYIEQEFWYSYNLIQESEKGNIVNILPLKCVVCQKLLFDFIDLSVIL